VQALLTQLACGAPEQVLEWLKNLDAKEIGITVDSNFDIIEEFGFL